MSRRRPDLSRAAWRHRGLPQPRSLPQPYNRRQPHGPPRRILKSYGLRRCARRVPAARVPKSLSPPANNRRAKSPRRVPKSHSPGATGRCPGATDAGDDAEDAGPAGRTVQQALTAVLEDAARRRATAIHLEAEPDGLTLRLRRLTGGCMRRRTSGLGCRTAWPPSCWPSARGWPASIRPSGRRPQHGRMLLRLIDQDVALGVAACPTEAGERLVITLRPRTAPTLEDLGLGRPPRRSSGRC